MKASDILNKALAEIKAFAVYEFTNIVDWLIKKGEIDPSDPESEICEIYLSDFGITNRTTFGVWVTNTYTDDFSYEKRHLAGFRFDREEKAVYVLDEETDYDEQDPIALRAVNTDDLVTLVDVLEEMWNTLVKR